MVLKLVVVKSSKLHHEFCVSKVFHINVDCWENIWCYFSRFIPKVIKVILWEKSSKPDVRFRYQKQNLHSSLLSCRKYIGNELNFQKEIKKNSPVSKNFVRSILVN